MTIDKNLLELPDVPDNFGWGGSYMHSWLKHFLTCLEYKFENLDSVFGVGGGSLSLSIFDPILFGDETFTPTTILDNNSSGNDLQDAINNASANDVIRIDSDNVFNPVVIPAFKPLTIYSGNQYNPVIDANNSKEYCILFNDQSQNVYIQGLELKNQSGSNTPGATDNAGAICVASPARVRNIILKDLYIHHCTEAGIQFQRMASVTNSPLSHEDMIRGIYIINCKTENCSINDTTENGGITLYDCRDFMIVGCESFNNLRGINAVNSINGFIVGNRTHNNTDAGIKLDSVPPNSFPLTVATIIDNVSYSNGNEGIRLDDSSSAYVINNTVVNNTREGIYIEDLSRESYIINNISINNQYGLRIDDNLTRVIALYNNCYNNSVSNYNIGANVLYSYSNMSLDIQSHFNDYSNNDFRLKINSPFNRCGYKLMPLGSLYQQSDPLTIAQAMSMAASRCAFFYNDLKGLTNLNENAVDIGFEPTTSTDWNSVPDNVKDALDELASRVKALGG